MSRQLTPAEIAALERPAMTTALLARLDFASGPSFLWTGQTIFTINGTGDALLDGNTFDPIAPGIMVDTGENTYTMEGSSEMVVTVAIPSDAATNITAAMYLKSEFQCRPATFWRGLLLDWGQPGVAPQWAFRRVRTGSMDDLQVSDDGHSKKLSITIEGFAGRISNATNSTYLDQTRFAPADISQNFAVACANGSPAPTNAPSPGSAGTLQQMGIPGYFADKWIGNGTIDRG